MTNATAGRVQPRTESASSGTYRQLSAEAVAAPLRKQVIGIIRESIISFEYPPGHRLVERELCERLGVSRTVIREALRHLEGEGLVDLVANRGPIVTYPTFESAKALYEVREVLESLAVRCFTERASASQQRTLEKALDHMEETCDSPDLRQHLIAKDDFYVALCEGAGNPAITSILRNVQARVQLAGTLLTLAPERNRQSIVELRGIVTAIKDGDADRASSLAREHVREAGAIACRILSESSNKPKNVHTLGSPSAR